jgi:hypothetical protein
LRAPLVGVRKKEDVMNIGFKVTSLTLAATLAIAPVGAMAMQSQQGSTVPVRPGTVATTQPKAPMQGTSTDQMMMDPAMRQQMMAQMQQCQAMMTQMMAHMQAMQTQGMVPNQPMQGDRHNHDRPPEKK